MQSLIKSSVLYIFTLFFLLFSIPITSVHAQEVATPSLPTAHLDVNNPHKQSQTFQINGRKITLTMSEELTPALAREYLPIGTFNKYFSYTDGVFTMKARFTGTLNPHSSRITSVSNGTFESHVGTFIRDRYSTGTYLNSNTGSGKYTVDYSVPHGGTYTISLFVWIVSGTGGGEINTTFMTGN